VQHDTPQLAYPERQVVAFVGDGGFSMLMAELATAVKYRLPIKVVIIKNGTLGQIKWEQTVFLGNPEYGVELQPIDFAAFARACGATGFTIDDPASCESMLEQALNTAGPVVVEGWSTRSSRRCPRKSRWSRRRTSPSRSSAASRIASVSR
jgi:pyruvate dehydrogenase (quinone)